MIVQDLFTQTYICLFSVTIVMNVIGAYGSFLEMCHPWIVAASSHISFEDANDLQVIGINHFKEKKKKRKKKAMSIPPFVFQMFFPLFCDSVILFLFFFKSSHTNCTLLKMKLELLEKFVRPKVANSMLLLLLFLFYLTW